MSKEEIYKELKDIGESLYNEIGTSSYPQRCRLHDLRRNIGLMMDEELEKAFNAGREKIEKYWHGGENYYFDNKYSTFKDYKQQLNPKEEK